MQKFCVIAEKLLEQHLEEVGITAEQFVKACEWGRNRRDVNREVFDQLMAIDDFLSALHAGAPLLRASRATLDLTWLLALPLVRPARRLPAPPSPPFAAAFKKMMIKRNMQLELEVIRSVPPV